MRRYEGMKLLKGFTSFHFTDLFFSSTEESLKDDFFLIGKGFTSFALVK